MPLVAIASLLLTQAAAPTRLDPAAVQHLVTRCKESNTLGLEVWLDGKPVLSRNFGNDWQWANLMSATKSITSMAVGILLDEGKIPSVDTPLQQFFPEFKGSHKSEVTIRHMLEHTSGIQLYSEEQFPVNRVAAALKVPIMNIPGHEFAYNNRAVDLLSGVVRRAAGMPLDDFVWKRIFQPIGIETMYWSKDPDGNPHGCAELLLTAKDMAKIGQLMLNKGEWKGKRILSEKYVEEATQPSKVTEKENSKCGWLWWISDPWFTIDQSSIDKLGTAGLPKEMQKRLEPLIGMRWSSVDDMGMDIARAAGGVPKFYAKVDSDFDFTTITVNAPDDIRDDGYYANGWGGQFILVIPRLKLVAARSCASGFFTTDDSSKYEMSDFYGLVRNLLPAPK